MQPTGVTRSLLSHALGQRHGHERWRLRMPEPHPPVPEPDASRRPCFAQPRSGLCLTARVPRALSEPPPPSTVASAYRPLSSSWCPSKPSLSRVADGEEAAKDADHGEVTTL